MASGMQAKLKPSDSGEEPSDLIRLRSPASTWVSSHSLPTNNADAAALPGDASTRDQQPPGPRRGLVRRSWWRWLSSSPPPCSVRFESRARD